MSLSFCTIITSNYFHYALTLYDSLKKYNPQITLNILILTSNTFAKKYSNIDKKIKLLFLEDICNKGLGKQILKKYGNDTDTFRWSMKSVFINYLLNDKNYDKIIWVDPDLFFVGDYNFLFEELEQNNIILTPHWRSINPKIDQAEFDFLFIAGLYNAGFIGVNKNGRDAMEWWANMCLFECKKIPTKGKWDDQTYLNLLPIYFDKVKILKHQGCNIAEWNYNYCKRSLISDGNILINNKWPLIFIHFTPYTIKKIISLKDGLLLPYLKEWHKSLKHYNPSFRLLLNEKKSLKQKIISKIRHYLNLIPSK